MWQWSQTTHNSNTTCLSDMTLIKISNVKGNQVHQRGTVKSVEKRVRQVGLSADYTVIAAWMVSNGGSQNGYFPEGSQRQCYRLNQSSANEQRRGESRW